MYSASQRQTLLNAAQESIAYGLSNHCALPINLEDYDDALTEHRATFVTLKMNGQLRGCIGTLEAYQPLITDITNNAYAAAFSDPRFSPLTEPEFEQLDIHLSILSVPEKMSFTSEADLIDSLQPGVDGIILKEGSSHRGTFLPSVWESLPDRQSFLGHLKQKAQLPFDYWSDTIECYRYTTESIE
ncbi:MAG: AmmeMemoRadiSam system protein A [Gammaproteobacteria bacterium]